jgi:hypothetical protein
LWGCTAGGAADERGGAPAAGTLALGALTVGALAAGALAWGGAGRSGCCNRGGSVDRRGSSSSAGCAPATACSPEGRDGAAALAQPRYVRHCGLGQKSTSPGIGKPHFGQSLIALPPSDSSQTTELSTHVQLSAPRLDWLPLPGAQWAHRYMLRALSRK